MTDASFSAAGYAVLIENDPLEKYTSTRKTFALVAYGSKTLIPTQLKMSIYAKEFLAIFLTFRHIICGTLKLVIILTDNESVTGLFQTMIIPSSGMLVTMLSSSTSPLRIFLAITTNTAADFLSRLEIS